MRILVLGAYGFIGLEVARRLASIGHEVVGLGRSSALGQRLLPRIAWIQADLANLTTPDAWAPNLKSVDAVVNAAGALQRGYGDDVNAVHHGAIESLVTACETAGVMRFVQISAVGASAQADTPFMRTKGLGDACVSQSQLDWVILRPGLVLGPNTYGGSALLRAVASVPLIQPVVHGKAKVQTVALDDVCHVVAEAISGNVGFSQTFDVVESEHHSLEEVTQALRGWLGYPPAPAVHVPGWMSAGVAVVADGLGRLGWRSPVRSSALTVLSQDILGDPAPLKSILGRDLKGLNRTLEEMPSTLQERWFGRLYLLLPLAVGVLCVFWVASGLIALINLDEAVSRTGLSGGTAHFAVLAGSVIDIALGLALLFRPWARAACWGMLLVCAGYLVLGTILVPEMWADPLGPLVKIVPIMMLVSVVMNMLGAKR